MFTRTSKSPKLTCVPARRSHQRSTLSASRRILNKTASRRLRRPLAIRNGANVVHLEQPHCVPVPLRLPRTLIRPQLSDIDRKHLETSYPELAHIPMEYIRKGLAVTGIDMLAAVTGVHAQPPANTLPHELEIVVNDMVSAHPPTHVLAIYSNNSATRKCKVTLFPAHELVLAAHCSHLPSFPISHPDTTKSAVQVPVVPLCLPSPETFSTLQLYLYTKRVDVLFATLLPAPPSTLSETGVPLPEMIKRLTHHLAATSNMPSLARHAMVINGVWRNACALGVHDDKLWSSIEFAWEAVVGAMSIGTPQC